DAVLCEEAEHGRSKDKRKDIPKQDFTQIKKGVHAHSFQRGEETLQLKTVFGASKASWGFAPIFTKKAKE
ncbi:MAG: hypothetical protein ACLFRE_01105, partial [Desulfovermiculus sp.]